MYFYQYILLAAYSCLLLNKETRLAAFVFLCGWLMYLIATIDLQVSYYYITSALIETVIGYSLNKRYRLISYLSYSLIIVNLFGLHLYKIGEQPYFYDLLYAIISTLQLLLLIARGLVYGVYRLSQQHSLVRVVDFDSRNQNRRMQDKEKTKEAYR